MNIFLLVILGLLAYTFIAVSVYWISAFIIFKQGQTKLSKETFSDWIKSYDESTNERNDNGSVTIAIFWVLVLPLMLLYVVGSFIIKVFSWPFKLIFRVK